jgi:hypothetical protein
VCSKDKTTTIKIDLLLLLVALLNLWLTHRQSILSSLRRRYAALCSFLADIPPPRWPLLRRE